MSVIAQMSVGELLASWRRRRRWSQLDLASEAGISQRHLSFVESGRSNPSRDMVLHLAECLSVPVRDRNGLLVAAGYAPSFREQPIDNPELAAARAAVQLILDGHQPHPALAVDRHWQLVLANRSAMGLLEGVDEGLLQHPINVLRVSLHPQGLGPRILNFREWRTHIVARLSREIELTGDQVLQTLLEEIKSFPVPAGAHPYTARPATTQPIAIPLRLASPAGPMSFISTTTVFGTALDITLSELTIETFFPADAATAKIMQSTSRRS
jgi:transcriptional regulator with XRE-family HTH domain